MQCNNFNDRKYFGSSSSSLVMMTPRRMKRVIIDDNIARGKHTRSRQVHWEKYQINVNNTARYLPVLFSVVVVSCINAPLL